MSRVLLISRSRKFESRLRSLVGADMDSIMGASLAKGAPAALERLVVGDEPEIALLGPALSYAQTYELSAGLSALYPRTKILLVRDSRGWEKERWLTSMKVDGIASPGLDDRALVQAVEHVVQGIQSRVSGTESQVPEVGADRPGEQEEMGGGMSESSGSSQSRETAGNGPTEDETAPTAPELAVDAPADPMIDLPPEAATDALPEQTIDTADPDSEPPPASLWTDTDEFEPPAHHAAESAGAYLVPDGVPAEFLPTFRGQVIAVVSPKGGMGKTTVATNLSVGLARLAPMSVVLVDADVQFGDVATALALDPLYSLPDAVSPLAANDAMALKTYLTPHPAGFFTICGSPSPVEGDRVTGDQLGHLIAQLAEVFRYVVIDTAPGLGEHTLSAIEQSTDVVALCGMSVTSARGLRKHLDVLAAIGIMPGNRHVVLNFTDRYSGLSVRDVEATTGVHMDVAIPRSKAIVLSSNRGIPVLQEKGRSPVSKAYTSLVNRFDPSIVRKHGKHLRTVALK